jgi:Uma2 family endonuclease
MTTMTAEALQVPHGRPLTRADLDGAPDDGHRYELMDGALLVTPAPRFRHQKAVSSLHTLLVAAAPEGTEVLTSPFDVVLAEDTVIQPDLLAAPRSAFTETDLPGPPLLAIEVLSPSTRSIDLLLKRDRLRRAGCPHYWVLDPDQPSLTAWTLKDDEYVEAAHAVGDTPAHLTEPFDLTIIPSELLA